MIQDLAKLRTAQNLTAVGAEDNPDKLSPGALTIFSSTFLFVSFIAYKKYGESPKQNDQGLST